MICGVPKFLVGVFLIFLSVKALAQVPDADDFNMENFVEELVSVQDQDLNYEELYELLPQRYLNPINLNTASLDDLRNLGVLTERQASNLINYRKLYGEFLTVYELQVVPGMHQEVIVKLLPFITVSPVKLKEDLSLRQRIRRADKLWLLRGETTMEEKKGYATSDTTDTAQPASRYIGSPHKVYSRFRIKRPGDFSVGFTTEKDAGEPLRWRKNTAGHGMDFWSFHVALENKGRLKSLVLGDYTLRFGHGLILGSGFALGKGAEPVNAIAMNSTGIRPYTSTLESGFFRGAAATYSFKMGKERHALLVSPFYSVIRQDARLPADSLGEILENSFSSVLSSGLHRTENELQAKNKVSEQTAGMNVLFQTSRRNLRIGMNLLNTNYSASIEKSDKPYRRFEFHGNQNFIGGISGDYVWQNTRFFGEVARSRSGGWGSLAGITSNLDDWLAVAMLVRNYERDFHSFYGSSFSENAKNMNEKGIYWGIKAFPIKKIILTAYYDKFTFPWLKYRIDQPSDGYEYLLRLSYVPNQNTKFHFQFREEQKEENVSTEKLTGIPPAAFLVLPRVKRNYHLRLAHQATAAFRLKTTVQFSNFQLNGQSTSGYVIAQDAGFQKQKWKTDIRFALFDTDYPNRQYLYENDVLYAFSIPALQGQGIRTYLVMRYELTRSVSIWGKIARTQYVDKDEIGSGLEAIQGNHKTDVKIQLRIRL